MNFLLKIVEGPMKGAEIALVEGLRVRVGSGEDCDIVLADATLPAEAFALDVKSDAVSFIRGEEIKTLVPFEIFEVGTSAFAIGPAEGAWEPLKREVKRKGEGEGEGEQGNVSPASVDAASSPRQAEDASSPASDATGTSRPQDASASSRPRHRGLLACCCALVVLLVALAAAWYFWPKITEKFPKAETARVVAIDKATAAWHWSVEKCASLAKGKKKPSAAPAAPAPTLADLARQYGLTLTNDTVASNFPLSSFNYQLLRGNFARRTERMAVRALALAADPTVKLELTDDESLAAAAQELLFVVTEDAIRATSATNGVVTLTGYAPSTASLERTLRALNDDVPGLRNVLTSAVRIGGIPPPRADEPKQVFRDDAACASGEGASRRLTKKTSSRRFPIAGILTTPYKTVVLENGMRVTEGGSIENVVVERIEPGRIVFRSGSTTFEWKP